MFATATLLICIPRVRAERVARMAFAIHQGAFSRSSRSR
jgi:hypothetical protein